MDIQFNQLESLHWLWGVLALLVVLILGIRSRRRRLAAFASLAIVHRLMPTISVARRSLRAMLLLAAMVALVAAMLDPRWGVTYEEVRQEGVDVMVVLDVSRSMLARDARPDRLTRARQYCSDLIGHLGSDRVGLVTFAGNATLACPLTIDHGAFRLSLQEASPDLAARGGSLIGDALRVAGDSFADGIEGSKIIVLFSDGEDHDSYPAEAAAGLQESQEIRIVTVGLGDSREGSRIPATNTADGQYMMHEGQQVWSKLDGATLAEIAVAGGGKYIPVGTGAVDMGQVYEQHIAPLTRTEFGEARVRRYHLQYQWFAGAALVLLLLESVIGDQRSAARRGWQEVMTS